MYVSVIIPSYKPQAYLWECLDSLFSQNLPKDLYEIVLVLNGCNEPYKSQIENWLYRHTEMNVNLIQTDEGGVSNARNIGIEAANGEYITFIDDDDLVSPKYLEELYDKADIMTVPLSYALSFIDGSTKKDKYYITNCYEKNMKLLTPTINSASSFFSGPVYKLIHRDIIGKQRFCTKLRVGEDTLFMFAISKKIKSIVFTSQEAVYYRRVRDNSASFSTKTLAEIIKNAHVQLIEYVKLLIKNPFMYNPVFAFTRIAGTFYGVIFNVIRYFC